MKAKSILTGLLIIILIGALTYKESLRKKEENKKEEAVEVQVSKELNTELRSLIPSSCGGYAESQYQSVKKTTDEIDEQNKDCANYTGHNTFTKEYKVEQEEDEIYIYDYVLIYSPKGECVKKDCKYWANEYDNFIYKEIEEDDNAYPTDEAFTKYGKIYKYTFIKTAKDYKYLSTEPIK